MNSIYLSVVIPTYNEESRIISTLEQTVGYLQVQNFSWEIIVVDDGSKDQTAKKVQEFIATHPEVIILSNPRNNGKGYVVRQGVLESKGKYVLFSDADLSTPIQEVKKLLFILEKGCDVAIGSRNIKNSGVTVVCPLGRQFVGETFNFLVRLLIIPGIRDTQCGFKCFRREVAYDLFGRQKMKGFSFDVEILYLAKLSGYSIEEVPVNWWYASSSKVNVFKDSLKMFRDVLEIRRRVKFEQKGKHNNSDL